MSDVVVVGAGIAGLFLARALRERGASVIVLERGPAACGEATARSAWMIRTDSDDEAIAPLARRGGELWRSDAWGRFRATGGFLIGSGGADELAAIVPAASGRGTFAKDDGVADPSSALRAGAPPAGTLRAGWPVDAIAPIGESVVARGPRGDVAGSVVVDAAGAWAGRLGGLPLTPLRRHVALTSSRALRPDAPFCWDVREGFYFRPHEEGLLLCACDESPSEPGAAPVDAREIERILALARRLQPGLGEQRLVASWAGQRTFAPDRRPVVGWDARTRGLFHLAGLGGHGVTLAPALAEAAAAAILAGPSASLPPSLRPFDPARLQGA